MKALEKQPDVFLGQYVMASQLGEVFPDVEAGIEDMGRSKTEGLPVPATTLDEYAKAMGPH